MGADNSKSQHEPSRRALLAGMSGLVFSSTPPTRTETEDEDSSQSPTPYVDEFFGVTRFTKQVSENRIEFRHEHDFDEDWLAYGVTQGIGTVVSHAEQPTGDVNEYEFNGGLLVVNPDHPEKVTELHDEFREGLDSPVTELLRPEQEVHPTTVHGQPGTLMIGERHPPFSTDKWEVMALIQTFPWGVLFVDGAWEPRIPLTPSDIASTHLTWLEEQIPDIHTAPTLQIRDEWVPVHTQPVQGGVIDRGEFQKPENLFNDDTEMLHLTQTAEPEQTESRLLNLNSTRNP